jgi:branched-chain amino acid transport system permease protein
MKGFYKIGCIAAALLLMVAYPLIAPKFYTYLFIEIMIFCILAVSYYLLLGHTGLLSLGHAGYFGVGAYCTAICLVRLPDLPVLLSMTIGILSGLLAGLLIGLMLLRLTKIYFAFGTLSLGQMLWAIAWKARSITGGDDGLTGWSDRAIFLPIAGSFSLGDLTFLYYFVAVIAFFSVGACWLFTRTALGDTLSNIRSNMNRVEFMGFNVKAAKLMVFGFSAMIAALAGSLFVLHKKLVSPECIDMFMSSGVVQMSVMGGYRSFVGQIVGSVVYVCLVEFLSSFIERWQLVMGALFVVLLLYYPGGAMGIARQIAARLGRGKR